MSFLRGRGEKRRKCILILRDTICYCMMDGYLTGGRRDYVSVGLTTNHNRFHQSSVPYTKKNIPRVEIWFTFGYGSHRLEKFPIGRAKHPGDSSRPLMKSFSTRTTISRESRKQHLWIKRKAICPSCSQRDVKSNPFVVSEYLGILPDPVGLASRCNGGIGTATSSGTSPPH